MTVKAMADAALVCVSAGLVVLIVFVAGVFWSVRAALCTGALMLGVLGEHVEGFD